jgi:hypothetical protein
MNRGHWVKHQGRLVSRSTIESDEFLPGLCPNCHGSGLVAETIDEEQFDVAVPCPTCQDFCFECKKWVTREGHQCQ